MKVWLSVIMPVHDGARHLGAALESAAAEAPDEGIEFRLYNSFDDGGSSRAVAERFSSRLNMVWQDRFDLTGWQTKTNLGVAEARGQWIAMLHQDDLWLRGHLASLVSAARKWPDVAMSIAPSRFADTAGRITGKWRLPFQAGRHVAREAALTLLVQNSIAIPSPLIRRDAWLACGGMDDTLWYTADWDLYLKLLAVGDMAVRPMSTTAFRLHGGSLTMQGRHQPGAMAEQLDTVLVRNLSRFAPVPSSVESRARVSVAMNSALAAASAGNLDGMTEAGLKLFALGPAGIWRYAYESRIVDRVWARLQLMLSRRI